MIAEGLYRKCVSQMATYALMIFMASSYNVLNWVAVPIHSQVLIERCETACLGAVNNLNCIGSNEGYIIRGESHDRTVLIM